MRQEQAVSRAQPHGLLDALDQEPALPGDDRVALDPFICRQAK